MTDTKEQLKPIGSADAFINAMREKFSNRIIDNGFVNIDNIRKLIDIATKQQNQNASLQESYETGKALLENANATIRAERKQNQDMRGALSAAMREHEIHGCDMGAKIHSIIKQALSQCNQSDVGGG